MQVVVCYCKTVDGIVNSFNIGLRYDDVWCHMNDDCHVTFTVLTAVCLKITLESYRICNADNNIPGTTHFSKLSVLSTSYVYVVLKNSTYSFIKIFLFSLQTNALKMKFYLIEC